MELVVDNVTGFPNRLMYLKMLRKADADFNYLGAVENKRLLTETCRIPITGLMFDKKFMMGSIDGSYEEVFVKANSYLYLDDISRVIDVTVLRFDKNYSEYEQIARDWESTKTDQLFPKIVEAHNWYESPIIYDLTVYLNKLYELGFRLVRNDKIRGEVKNFYVNLDNVVVDITIDYNAISSIVEIMDMEPL